MYVCICLFICFYLNCSIYATAALVLAKRVSGCCCRAIHDVLRHPWGSELQLNLVHPGSSMIPTLAKDANAKTDASETTQRVHRPACILPGINYLRSAHLLTQKSPGFEARPQECSICFLAMASCGSSGKGDDLEPSFAATWSSGEGRCQFFMKCFERHLRPQIWSF